LEHKDLEFQQRYFELLLNILVKLQQEHKVMEVLSRLEAVLAKQYAKESNEYGFFLVEKGRSVGKFNKYEEAVGYLVQGLDSLIELKCKDKLRIMDVYITMAEAYRKLGQPEKAYSSLVCGLAMAKQVTEPESHVLSLTHLLAANLTER
jgi:tetratricopeptide (TPR) repeat protein